MDANKLTTREEVIFLLRGFFATPILSGLAKHGILNKILEGNFKIDMKKKINNDLLKDSLDYLCDLGITKKNKDIYNYTNFGKKIVKRQGSFVLLHSYHEYMSNYSKSLLNNKIKSKCDRLENVIGSGLVHGRKYFESGLKKINISFKSEIDTYVDMGCGDGKFLSMLNKNVKNCNIIGIDFSKISVKQTLKKLKNEKNNTNTHNAFNADVFDFKKIQIKLNKLEIHKNASILFTFWFVLHESSMTSFVDYFRTIRKQYKNAKFLICEINKVESNILIKNKLNTLMPEYFHFHNISKQKLFSKKFLKNNLASANFNITNEINFDKYKFTNKKMPSIYIYYAETKI